MISHDKHASTASRGSTSQDVLTIERGFDFDGIMHSADQLSVMVVGSGPVSYMAAIHAGPTAGKSR